MAEFETPSQCMCVSMGMFFIEQYGILQCRMGTLTFGTRDSWVVYQGYLQNSSGMSPSVNDSGRRAVHLHKAETEIKHVLDRGDST